MRSERMTDRAWFTRHPVLVAWDLIGCVLNVHRDGVEVAGRIVEVEAYAGPTDPASHAGRLTVARRTMSGPPGTVYTYLSYGIHTMMNIVSHEEGQSGGILLRALQPLDGLDHMHARRNGVAEVQLARGPGSLGQAMGIRLTDIGTDLMTSVDMSVLHGEAKHAIHAGPRIGISRAVLAPWRFFEYPSPYVSGHRRGHAVTREQVPGLIPPPGTPIE
jgi:DNA-3-methyladenine glycosylase